MSRRTDHCLRCGYLGRRRSFERGYHCSECQHIRDAEAELRKSRRMGEDIDIIADAPTASHIGIDLLDRRIFLPSATNENSSYTIVAPTEGFGYVARNHGINISQVDYFADRTTVLTTEIDPLSGKNLTLILFPAGLKFQQLGDYWQEPKLQSLYWLMAMQRLIGKTRHLAF